MKKLLIPFVFLLAAILGVLTFYFLKKSNFEIAVPIGSLTGGQKDEFVENPLNGVKVPRADADKVLSRRPFFVQIGNNIDARPQSNVSQADMVYEVVAEGGITRFSAVFLQNEPEKIGPVRSMRAYFLYWILELGDAMVMHDGWSSSPIREVSAIDLIDDLHVRSLFRGGLYGYRDNSREAPNNEYISTKVAREHGDKLGWQGVGDLEKWSFKDDKDGTYSSNPDAKQINVIFWTTGDYDSTWTYDAEKNIYMKATGGVPHKDLETGVQLFAKNVIVQFAKETAVNDEKHHLLYDNVGSGKAIVFLDGKKIDATWLKKDIRARTKFYDMNGNEIKFNRGIIWIDVVPDRNIDQVTVKETL